MDTITQHVSFKQGEIDFESKTIEYAPDGLHRITPRVDGVGRQLTLAINADIANKLNQDLQARIKAAEKGDASRPFIDFDHQGGRAAGIPKRIYWDDGIRMELEWTRAGKEAIQEREYSYFSPELMLNMKDETIAGLPQVGSIGSLVNAPAFQKIERLAAASSNPQPQPTPKMDELKEALAKLAAAEAKLATSEQEVATLTASLEQVTAERDEVKGKFEKLEASHADLTESANKLQEKADEARKAKITAAVEAKAIPEDNREAIVNACIAAEDDGESILAAFSAPQPGGHKPLDKNANKKVDDKKVKQTGLARLAAGIDKNLVEKGLKNG